MSSGFFWSGADEPYPADPWTNRKRRWRTAFFAGVWLTPLIGAYASAVHHRQWLAVAGVTAFVALYLSTVVVAFVRQSADPSRRDQLMLAATTVVGAALIIGYAKDDHGWLSISIYLTAAGAALYRPPKGVYWIAGVVTFLVVVGFFGHLPVAEIAESAFSLVLAGAVVLLVRQAIRLIQELRRTRGELARSAVEQERLRFARDLHDLLGHSLSLIVVKAELTQRLAGGDPAAARQEAAEIEQVGRQALAEVRQTVSGYRSLRFEDELRRAKDALADAGIEAIVRVSGNDEPLPSTLDDAFAWVVREGTTNIIRHSGASSCVIALTGTRLEIRDDGKGGADKAHGNGLRGLAERMANVGGQLSTVDNGGGFVLRASVP